LFLYFNDKFLFVFAVEHFTLNIKRSLLKNNTN